MFVGLRVQIVTREFPKMKDFQPLDRDVRCVSYWSRKQKWMQHLVRMGPEPLLKQILRFRPGGKRDIGRQRNRRS
jgi:hypothetical protein